MIRSIGQALLCAVLLASNSFVARSQAAAWAGAMQQAARAVPDARVAVLDVHDGRIVASRHLDELARTLAAPGSTLKPILLYQALQAGLWSADRRVLCRRSLVIREHRLVCSHPAAPPFTAREALTWSCNTYFADLARAIPPERLESMLRPTGLLDPTRLVPGEAVAELQPLPAAEDTELAALGVDGIRVTPLELAAAYRWLAIRMMADPASIAARTVLGGLSDSASFGIAGEARLGGVPVAGKTGTAETLRSLQTHGWFVGLAPASSPEIVVVVYLPSARGADAARLAGLILGSSPMVRK